MKMIQRSIKSFCIVVFVVFASVSLFAQQEDFRVRMGVGFAANIANDLSGSVEFEQRLKNNAKDKDRSILQMGLEYQLFSNFEIAAAYRLSYLYHSYENNETKQRVNVNLSYGKKIAQLKSSYRCRWQYGANDIFSHFESTSVMRHRFLLQYNPFGLPLSPYISWESFSELGNDAQGLFQGMRYVLGIKYDIKKNLSLKGAYLRDVELNKTNAETINSMSLSLAYRF